jgi:hypothetical protein
MRDPICYQYFLLTVDMGGDVRYSMHNRIPLVDLAFHRGGTKLG